MNDFWEWIDQTLVPGLYNGAWYNGNTGQPGFLNDKMSFVVGVARIRQLRVKNGMNSDSMHCAHLGVLMHTGSRAWRKESCSRHRALRELFVPTTMSMKLEK